MSQSAPKKTRESIRASAFVSKGIFFIVAALLLVGSGYAVGGILADPIGRNWSNGDAAAEEMRKIIAAFIVGIFIPVSVFITIAITGNLTMRGKGAVIGSALGCLVAYVTRV